MKKNKYILMLESDEHDRETSSKYFETSNISYEFLKFSHEVIPFLKQRRQFGLLPSIILLSMNSMPEMGISVLKEIKSVTSLKHIPVILLGENTQSNLIKESYANGASTFINKPFTNTLTDLSIKSFIQYWFEVAQLPDESPTLSGMPG
ncbi:MAG: response regulator [Bacteroidota bacterium]